MSRPRDDLFCLLCRFLPGGRIRVWVRNVIDDFFNFLLRKQALNKQHTSPSISTTVRKYVQATAVNHASLLKNNLDSDSITLIDRYVERHLSDSWSFTKEELEALRKTHNIHVPYPFAPGSAWFHDVFVFHNGLMFLPPSALKQISGGCIIDGGAAAGDSAVMFATYHPRKIYAVEPFPEQITALRETIRLNALEAMVEIIPFGLDSQSNKSISIATQNENPILFSTLSIDDLAADKIISVIKLDIEGMEYDAIRGAQKTIMRDKPILLICLYHTGKDFFEIKPLLESYQLGYTFMVRETELCTASVGVHVMLIGYVEK